MLATVLGVLVEAVAYYLIAAVCFGVGIAVGMALRGSTASVRAERKSTPEPTFGGDASIKRATPWLTTRHSVDASAFAPAAVSRKDWFRVEVAVFRPRDAHKVGSIETRQQGVRRSIGKVARGQSLSIVLEGSGAEIDPSVRQLLWDGSPQTVAFRVRPSAGFSGSLLLLDASLYAGPIYIGSLALSVNVVVETEGRELTKVGTYRQPRRVFISYSSDDRADALRVAQAYNALGIEVFQDVWSLRAGEDWESRLYAEIDRSDCFVLCWSRSAARSGWVEAEIKRALDRQDADPDRLPRIVTYPLEGPPIPKPPPALAHLHFNDPLYLLRVAEGKSPIEN